MCRRLARQRAVSGLTVCVAHAPVTSFLASRRTGPHRRDDQHCARALERRQYWPAGFQLTDIDSASQLHKVVRQRITGGQLDSWPYGHSPGQGWLRRRDAFGPTTEPRTQPTLRTGPTARTGSSEIDCDRPRPGDLVGKGSLHRHDGHRFGRSGLPSRWAGPVHLQWHPRSPMLTSIPGGSASRRNPRCEIVTISVPRQPVGLQVRPSPAALTKDPPGFRQGTDLHYEQRIVISGRKPCRLRLRRPWASEITGRSRPPAGHPIRLTSPDSPASSHATDPALACKVAPG